MARSPPYSPHTRLAGLRCEAYFGFAQNDPFVSAAEVQALSAQLALAGLPSRVEIYPETGHGFAFQDRGTYNAEAAEQHWRQLLDLLARRLRAGKDKQA